MEDTRVICPPLGISWGNTPGHSMEKISQSLQTIRANFPFPSNLHNQSGSRENHLGFDALMGCFLFHFPQMDHLISQKSHWCRFAAIILISSVLSFVSQNTRLAKANDEFLIVTTLNTTWTDTEALTGSLNACCVTWGRPAASNLTIRRATTSSCRDQRTLLFYYHY